MISPPSYHIKRAGHPVLFLSLKSALLFVAWLLIMTCTFSKVHAQIRVVKLNLPSAAFGTAAMSFEKVRDKQFAWQITATYRPSMKGLSVPFERAEPGWSFNDSKIRIAGGQLSYRWYTRRGRSQPAKPYVAFFTQYQHWSGSFSHRYEGVNHHVEGDWNQSIIGIQYGTQWVIHDAWSIDLTLVGFGLAFGNVRGIGNSSEETNVGLWEEQLLNIPLIGQYLKMRGTESPYRFDARYTGVGIHTALRIGILF